METFNYKKVTRIEIKIKGKNHTDLTEEAPRPIQSLSCHVCLLSVICCPLLVTTLPDGLVEERIANIGFLEDIFF